MPPFAATEKDIDRDLSTVHNRTRRRHFVLTQCIDVVAEIVDTWVGYRLHNDFHCIREWSCGVS